MAWPMEREGPRLDGEGKREAPWDKGKGLTASNPKRWRETLPSADSSPSMASDGIFQGEQIGHDGKDDIFIAPIQE